MENTKTNGNFSKPKKDYSGLMESPYVEKWLNGIKSTQGRLGVFKKYCEFLGKTPEELILEHHEDILNKPMEKTHIAKNQLHSYFGYLTAEEDKKYKNLVNNKVIEKTVSWNSARQYVYSKILSFYNRNDVPVNFKKKEIPQQRGGSINKTWMQEGKKLIREDKREGLKNLVNAFNTIRDRTIVLCKISSGLDNIDLFKLKVKNFNDGYFDDYEVSYIDGNRTKNGIYFQTFFNSEASKSIKLMLKDRERKEEVIDDNSWLFVGNKKVKGKYTQMKPAIFYNDLSKICESLNITNITPKSFRRYFNSSIKKGLDAEASEVAERMMGHQIGVKGHYQDMYNDMEEFTIWYVENIEHKTLLFTQNGRIIKLDKRVEELETQNNELRELIENQGSKYEELAKLIKELQEKEKK